MLHCSCKLPAKLSVSSLLTDPSPSTLFCCCPILKLSHRPCPRLYYPSGTPWHNPSGPLTQFFRAQAVNLLLVLDSEVVEFRLVLLLQLLLLLGQGLLQLALVQLLQLLRLVVVAGLQLRQLDL